MAEHFYFAAKSISTSTRHKACTRLKAAAHNKREIQAELGAYGHIDAKRTALNEVLAGPATAAEVEALALRLLAAIGVNEAKLRKDHCQAIELVFSLPSGTPIDHKAYFSECLSWGQRQFGADNTLGADIHRDEAAPHCHVLFLPLADGRHVGSGLIGRPQLAVLRKSFFTDVASRYGFKAGTAKLFGEQREHGVKLVNERLENAKDGILNSALWPLVSGFIAKTPAPYMEALGIDTGLVRPAKKMRTMAQIFTSPGKGPKFERGKKQDCSPRVKPIGFATPPPVTAEKHQNLSCVGFNAGDTAIHDGVSPQVIPVVEVTRVRDTALNPALFDETTGEHRSPVDAKKRWTHAPTH